MKINLESLFKRSWKLGVAVGLVSTLLAKLTPMIPALNIQMATIDVRSQAIQGLDTTITQKILAFLNGFVSLPGVVLAIITGILLVMVGKLIFEFVRENFGLKVKNIYEKTVLTLLFGWIVLSLIAQLSLKLPAWTTFAAVAIYFIITTVIIVYGAKWLGIDLEY